jgi:hypothetical protein
MLGNLFLTPNLRYCCRVQDGIPWQDETINKIKTINYINGWLVIPAAPIWGVGHP